MVTSLESAGLVARQTDGADRRVVRVRITAEGRRNLQRIRTLNNGLVRQPASTLSPTLSRNAACASLRHQTSVIVAGTAAVQENHVDRYGF